jgi:hypothetical protein
MLESDKVELNHLYLYKSYRNSNEYYKQFQSNDRKSDFNSTESNINKYSKNQKSNDIDRQSNTRKKDNNKS